MKFNIYGASDDLVEFEGDVCGEVGCYDRGVEVVIGAPGAQAFVTLWYARKGTDGAVWEAAIRQGESGVGLPASFVIRRCDNARPGEVGYSVVVEVEAPNAVPVACRTVPLPGNPGQPGGWETPS